MVSYILINSRFQVSYPGPEAPLVHAFVVYCFFLQNHFIEKLFQLYHQTGFPQALEIMENLENH